MIFGKAVFFVRKAQRIKLMLNIRKAVLEDIPRLMEIFASARSFMAGSGNPNQWPDTYPPLNLIGFDIERGACHAVLEDGVIHGVFVAVEGKDPTYDEIDGSWLNDEPYVTIHRIAGDGKVHGIFDSAVDFVRGYTDNIRIDTHEKNLTMQRHILKQGFVYCGIIITHDGTPRLAYQWSRTL